MDLIWCQHFQLHLLMIFALRCCNNSSPIYDYACCCIIFLDHHLIFFKPMQLLTSYFVSMLLVNQVTASSWLNDLRDQVERTRVLNVVYRSATALGSRLPGLATAKARVFGVGALLRPVSTGTQVTSWTFVFCQSVSPYRNSNLWQNINLRFIITIQSFL